MNALICSTVVTGKHSIPFFLTSSCLLKGKTMAEKFPEVQTQGELVPLDRFLVFHSEGSLLFGAAFAIL